VERILAARKYLRQVILCGQRVSDRLFWDDFLANECIELAAYSTFETDAAFWLWTSGTTGMPKAVVHLERNWLCCCKNYAEDVLNISSDDVMFSSSKLFHAYGLRNRLMFPFYAGATSILYPGRAPASAILATAHASRPTLLFSVPTLYNGMLKETDRVHSYDLTSIRVAVSAAELLPAGIFRKWKARFGIEILDGLGSTEALHIYLSARAGKVRPGGPGEPVEGYEIRVLDNQGKDVLPGTIGDLIVRGDSLASHYWNRPELSAERFRDGWFESGDNLWADQDGYLWYAGRSDEMLRVSGQWVSPVEVEGALAEHSSVLEAAVVPYRESDGLYTVKAFVTLREDLAGTSSLVKELQTFVKQRIAPYKYPRRIQFLTELPKNAAGKLLRYKLRELDGNEHGD
jgi:benzoate-CoA ligase family protein